VRNVANTAVDHHDVTPAAMLVDADVPFDLGLLSPCLAGFDARVKPLTCSTETTFRAVA